MRRRATSAIALTCCLLSALLTTAAAKPSSTARAGHRIDHGSALPDLPPPPKVAARSWAVYDGVDGQLLAGVGAERAAPIASLTKIMTALVVVERTQGDEKVTASKAAAAAGDGSEIDMRAGQTYTVDTLLQAMLVYSANDAAVALAEYVGGDQKRFIAMMNDRASDLKLQATRYTSVNGLDAGPVTKSSPADLVTLAEVAMKDPRIRLAIKLRSVRVPRPGTTPVTLATRNDLLGTYDGVDGVKTGFTDTAGRCFLTHWSASNVSAAPTSDGADADELTAEEIAAGTDDASSTGQQDVGELWVVVLGEREDPARFQDTIKLLDWARPLRQKLRFAASGDRIVSVPVQSQGTLVPLYLSDDVAAEVRVGTHVTEKIVVPGVLQPPLRAGDEIGRYELRAGGKVIASSRLFVEHGVRPETRSERLRRYARAWDNAFQQGWKESRHQTHRLARYWGLA